MSGLFQNASARLRSDVPYDAAAWVATDPATGLPAAPTVVENLAGPCHDAWRLEFTTEDVNLFRDLAPR